MTEDLPFVHDPEDPSPERTAHAHERVRGAVRRRRSRRRALTAVPVILLVLLGGAAVLAQRGGDHGSQVIAAGATAPRALDVNPTTKWSSATLSADGRTLTIEIGTQPDGTGPCEQRFDHDVVETEDSVTIGFELEPKLENSAGGACELSIQQQTFTIELEQPLGDRDVYDGVQPNPQQVFRLSDLVEVTWVPDGFERSAVDPGEAGGNWQQTFMDDGADWYFAVNQRTEGAMVDPDVTSTPVTVHGIGGQRYTGQMNGTMESIHWVEDGIDLTVWGEMQGPPSFTHSDELLQIAEGIRVPVATGPSNEATTSTVAEAPASSTTTVAPTIPLATTTASPPVAGSDLVVGSGYYVDVDLRCDSFTLGGTWVLVEGDPSSWQPPGERHEGGTFTLDTPTTGTFRGDAEGKKVATFRLLGASERPRCQPVPR